MFFISIHFFIYTISSDHQEEKEMNYKYIFSPSEAITFQGKKADALKRAKKNNMYIKTEKNGFFVLVKNAEAVIYEYDSSNKIVRQADARPYIKENYSTGTLTENRVQSIVDSLNAGDIVFDDVCKAAS